MTETNRIRVLLIDDELDEQDSRVDDLRQSNMDVDVVRHADEVPRMLERSKGKYDAVVLDIMLPPEGYASLKESQGGRFTGALILRDIRRYLANVPVIVVSAHTESDARPKLPGIAAFLEKPVLTDDIVAAIRAARPAS